MHYDVYIPFAFEGETEIDPVPVTDVKTIRN